MSVVAEIAAFLHFIYNLKIGVNKLTTLKKIKASFFSKNRSGASLKNQIRFCKKAYYMQKVEIF